MISSRYCLIITFLFAVSWIHDVSWATNAADLHHSDWSERVNGFRARLSIKRLKISNGSCIMATYLELDNQGSPKSFIKSVDSMTFRVTDKDGNEVAVNRGMTFSGWAGGTPRLTLPHDSSIRFRIGPTGHGIGRDLAAHLDLGIDYCWSLPKGDYFLSGILEVVSTMQSDEAVDPWHGRIVLPRVLIPTTDTNPLESSELGRLINTLGGKVIANQGEISEDAANQLSLINDPRVVPWYLKALSTQKYDLKHLALDRLAYFESGEAFEGLKIGFNTQTNDFDGSLKPKLAQALTRNIRVCALNGLARSPHPDARKYLLGFHNDADPSIRLGIIQFAARLGTEESKLIVKAHMSDDDSMVKGEAIRLFEKAQTAPSRFP